MTGRKATDPPSIEIFTRELGRNELDEMYSYAKSIGLEAAMAKALEKITNEAWIALMEAIQAWEDDVRPASELADTVTEIVTSGLRSDWQQATSS